MSKKSTLECDYIYEVYGYDKDKNFFRAKCIDSAIIPAIRLFEKKKCIVNGIELIGKDSEGAICGIVDFKVFKKSIYEEMIEKRKKNIRKI